MMDYSGFHLGIVVQNNDPNFWGRVKVFVPEHSPNIDKLNKWIDDGNPEGKDKWEFLFNAVDKEISPQLMEIFDDLKELLPWANFAGPIFGGNADGRFRRVLEKTARNDTATFGEAEAQNAYRPLNAYVEDRVNDKFIQTDPGSKLTNPNASDYEPCNYSGMVRGIFSIPNVGAKVYVFYQNNDPMFPVYFAASYNSDSIKQLYTGLNEVNKIGEIVKTYDYPGKFENDNVDDDNSKVFTSKTVINSNKHTIEFIDTDNRESLKLQHYAGGFKEFNNATNIEFAPKNDQKLVKGDEFETVGGSKGLYIGADSNIRVDGNSSEQIGRFYDLHKELENLRKPLKDLGQTLQLFPVKRTLYDMTPKDCSTKQKMVPIGNGFIICPTCGGVAYDPYHINGLNIPGTFNEDADKQVNELANPATDKKAEFTAKADDDDAEYHEQLDTDDDSVSRVEYGWSRIPKATSHCVSLFEDVEAYFKSNHKDHASCGKLGFFGGIMCPTCNNVFWRENTSTSMWTEKPNAQITFSPSTENGTWQEEDKRSGSQIQSAYTDIIDKARDVFTNLGEQGEEVKKVSMSKVEVIGAMFNDLPSYRVDPIGKLRVDGLFVTQQSTVPYYLPTPHVEPVDVPQIPGGDYNLTIGNKWTVSVGSNGIIIHTTGRMELAGGITNIATQELIMSAKHDMVIDGGERLMLRARKMTINPVEHNALTVDGQLHVMRNQIIRGGLLVEGELAVQHVTAPGEIAVTQTEMYTGGENEACEVKVVIQLDLAAEGIGELGPDVTAGTEAATKKKKSKWSRWKHTVVGGVLGSFAGGTGTIGGAIAGYLIGRDKRKTSNQYSQAFSAIGGAINGLIAALQAPMDATLRMPSHNHAFLQIPASFKDCPNGVRAALLTENNNINSRTIIVAARRRHHVGAFKRDPKVDAMYEKYGAIFWPFMFETVCQNLPSLEGNLRGKGLDGHNNTGDKMFVGPVYGYSDGDTGMLVGYSIRDYFNKTLNTTDHAIAMSNKNKFGYIMCVLTFKLTGDGDDDDFSGGFKPAAGTSPTATAMGFYEDTIEGDMVGDNEYLRAGDKECQAVLLGWCGKYSQGMGCKEGDD
jgi:uncharacterized Zn finger protein (UPF0148 family)